MKLTTSILVEQFKSKHGDRYDYSLVEYIKSNVNVKIICSKHGIFEQRPEHHKRGANCHKCNIEKSRLSKDQVIEQFKSKHGDRYDYSLVGDNVRTDDVVKIICSVHGDFPQKVNNHKNGQGCPNCCKTDLTDFIFKANNVHNYFYNYDKVDYKGLIHNVIITCPIHGDFPQTPHNHVTNETKCKKCVLDSMKLTYDEFVDKANIVHNNRYDYSNSVYISHKDDIEIICYEHGIFTQNTNNHLNGKGCSACKDSKGETKIRKYLDTNNIKYEKQKIFEECVYKTHLKFDFYLPDYNLIIEYDGEHHFKPIMHFGGEEALLEYIKKDKIKNEYCETNNIQMLRIPYFKKKEINSILDKFKDSNF